MQVNLMLCGHLRCRRKKIKHIKTKFVSFIIILILFAVFPQTYTPKITDSKHKVIKDSIAELFMLNLGNKKQAVMIRGVDINNPIIIFLHGGPGYPCISYIRKYQKNLEENFTIVNWDQRGSGKSFSFGINRQTMSKEQLLDDLDELVDYLCARFKKNKVYLVGHSWGTVLGIEYINRSPQKIIAYIGVGQVVDYHESEKIGHKYTLDKAYEKNDTKAINQLLAIGDPPYKIASDAAIIQRKWLNRYGGNEIHVITRNEMLKGSFLEPEYSITDAVRFIIGNGYSVSKLYKYLEEIDFRKNNVTFTVPVYFCAGNNDYVTPSVLVEQYYDCIKAPKKGLFWFENSAHDPQLEEHDKFYNVMMQIYNENR